MSTQMGGDYAHEPWDVDSEPWDIDSATRRTRIRRLFSCRSRKGEPEPENPHLPGRPSPADDPPPLYFILSEVASEEMDCPSTTMENKKDGKALKNRACCLRIPGFKNCFKDESHKDEETASLGKENTTFEEGDSRVLPSDTSSFEMSSNSACSSVIPNKYVYPVQARRDEYFQEQVSIKGLENDGFAPSEEDVSSFTDSSFTDSSYFKGAQLILQAFSEDSGSSDFLLGVAFPHPAIAGESCILKDSACRLGIQTGHPFWNKREKSNVWRYIDSDPMDEAISLSPSPIVVETSTNDEDGWDDDDDDWNNDDDEDWNNEDDEDWNNGGTAFPSTNDDSYESHRTSTRKDDPDDADSYESHRTSTRKDGPDDADSYESHRASTRKDDPDDADSYESHRTSTRKDDPDDATCLSIDSLNDNVENKPKQAEKPSSLPDRLTKNVLEPMCEFAREISSCGRVDDAGFFDDAPFDEIALDRERKTVGQRVKTFTKQKWTHIPFQNHSTSLMSASTG
jgi:hypothetical protein